MSMTEAQQRLLEKQQELIEAHGQLSAALAKADASSDTGDGLSPDEEAAVGLYLTDVDELIKKVLDLVDDLLTRLG